MTLQIRNLEIYVGIVRLKNFKSSSAQGIHLNAIMMSVTHRQKTQRSKSWQGMMLACLENLKQLSWLNVARRSSNGWRSLTLLTGNRVFHPTHVVGSTVFNQIQHSIADKRWGMIELVNPTWIFHNYFDPCRRWVTFCWLITLKMNLQDIIHLLHIIILLFIILLLYYYLYLYKSLLFRTPTWSQDNANGTIQIDCYYYYYHHHRRCCYY